MDITDIFPIDQIEELRKYGLLNENHYIRYRIGREFELLLDEGKTYEQVTGILSNKVYNFFGDNRCYCGDSLKNMYVWYRKNVKDMDS